MTVDADQLHPPPSDGLVAADERRKIAGLDNVTSVLQSSPMLKKLPVRKMSFPTPFSVTTLWQGRKANQSPCGSRDTMNSLVN